MSPFTPFFVSLPQDKPNESPLDLVLLAPASEQQGSTHPFNERQIYEKHYLETP